MNRCALLFAVSVLAFCSCAKRQPPGNPLVTRSAYDRIETGMTLSLVESFLGKGKEISRTRIHPLRDEPVSQHYIVMDWVGNKIGIRIVFRASGEHEPYTRDQTLVSSKSIEGG